MFVLSDDEVEQMAGLFNVKPVQTETILLRCRACQATAFPLTAEGLCVNENVSVALLDALADNPGPNLQPSRPAHAIRRQT